MNSSIPRRETNRISGVQRRYPVFIEILSVILTHTSYDTSDLIGLGDNVSPGLLLSRNITHETITRHIMHSAGISIR